MTREPLAIDLYCGLGGWTEGLLDAGFRVVGFDIEVRPYPGTLVLQDVTTLHGAQFREAALIVASPPCQAYSYRAMPWKRAKALPPPDNTLFDACFRIQREASEAAGRHIPMVVENVCGAQKWVGRAKWHFGSYYLWGDVPAIMPLAKGWSKVPGLAHGTFPAGSLAGGYIDRCIKNGGSGTWFFGNTKHGHRADPRDIRRDDNGDWVRLDGTKFGGGWWHDSSNNLIRKASSHSEARKAASALIAKIPYPLARWIGEVYFPK